jgi:hypothetical protein
MLHTSVKLHIVIHRLAGTFLWQKHAGSSSVLKLALNMEAVCPSEQSVSTYVRSHNHNTNFTSHI